jgi:hypothetical protein
VFQFTAHPATIGVTDGVQVAVDYLQRSWRRWLPAVVVVALCAFVAYTVLVHSVQSLDFRAFYYVDPDTNQIVWYPDGQARLWSSLVPFFALGLVTGVMTMIAGWVFAATAIAGLRNQSLTIGRVVSRGLLTIAAGLLIALAFIGAGIVWLVITVMAPPVGILALLVAIPGAIYVAIRLTFLSLAIFDGFGPIEAIHESWRISQRSVLRLFGWGLMALLLTLGFAIVGGIASSAFSAAGPIALGQAASTAVTTTGSCLTVFLMAVLYESQRARSDPTLYGPPPIPVPAYAYQWPGYTYTGGPAPGSPPAGPYPAAPGSPVDQWAPPPAQGSGMPGWVNPNAPASGWQGGQWAPPPAQGSGIPGWVNPNQLPYEGSVPGYGGSQPPRWQPQPGFGPPTGPSSTDDPASHGEADPPAQS